MEIEKTVKIGDIVKIYKGKKVASVCDAQMEGAYRFIQIDDLRNNSNLKFTQDFNVYAKSEDVIIAWDGANAGTVGYGLEGVIGSTLAKLEIQNKDFLGAFLGRFLQSKFQYLRDKCTGATIPHISRKVLNKLEVPFFPIKVQKQIAKILDQTCSLQNKRKKVINFLDDYVDSVFFNMFVKHGEKRKIPFVRLEDITTKITDGVHFKPTYVNSGVPFISVKNITTKKLNFDDCKFISPESHETYLKRCCPEFGDILYSKVGATYGRACVVDVKKEFSLYVSVALIKPKRKLISPVFLKAMLNSQFVKRQADKSVKGAGVPDLHLIEIKSFKIPLPSMEDQNKFTEIVEEVELLKRKMQTQERELDIQFQALMQKAFKGEL